MTAARLQSVQPSQGGNNEYLSKVILLHQGLVASQEDGFLCVSEGRID